MYIGWDDVLVEGYPINAAASETAESPNAMTFQFTFYVTNYINIAAQRGFIAQRAAKVATIRGGGDGYWAKKLTDFPDRRNHALDWFGTYGVDKLSNLARTAATWNNTGIAGAVGEFAGATVGKLADGVLKAGAAYMIGEQAGNLFMRDFLGSMMFNSLKFWKDIGVGEAQRAAGWAPGEIDAWFGFVGNIMNRIDVTMTEATYAGNASGVEIRKLNPNWLGNPSQGATALEALKAGSVDALIGSMTYAAVNEIGFTTDTVYTGSGGVANTNPTANKAKPATAMTVRLGPMDVAENLVNPADFGGFGSGAGQYDLSYWSGQDKLPGDEAPEVPRLEFEGSGFLADPDETLGTFDTS